jgi:hypothetical protein
MSAKYAVLPLLPLMFVAGVYAETDRPASVSTAPASAPAPQERRDVVFYSDLGPDQIDVSGYPAPQRAGYAVYARACSRCHSLARSINAPYTSRGWWEFYMSGMRMRGRAAGRPFSREEAKSVLDFLDYDSRVRKVEHASEFEKSAKELKRRFDDFVDERMKRLQKSMPKAAPWTAR